MTTGDAPPAPRATPDPARTARRSLTVWLAVCVLGAGLVLLASGRTWVTVVFDPKVGALGSGRVALSGGRLSPLISPVALAALAATVAVLATRGLARRAIGVVIALCGIGVAAAAWTGTRTGAITVAVTERAAVTMTSRGAFTESVAWAWPVLTAVGGAILLAGGVLAAVRGGRWPGMSGRYDRPSSGAGRTGSGPARPRGAPSGSATSDRALWDAIDEGADPTLEPGDPVDRDGPAGSVGHTGNPGNQRHRER